MLAEGFTTRHGPRAAYVHRDAVNGTLRGRRGGKLYAVTSGGTIPENADYAVILEPQGMQVGTVNEDFAVESLAGDVFQLGNASYRILRIESGRVRVEDAQGQPPNIPFWLGEAPGRSDELSMGVARLRKEIDRLLDADDDAQRTAVVVSATVSHQEQQAQQATAVAEPPSLAYTLERAIDWLTEHIGIEAAAARQIVDYLARARHALTALPTQTRS